jgi:hypothetical protein
MTVHHIVCHGPLCHSSARPSPRLNGYFWLVVCASAECGGGVHELPAGHVTEVLARAGHRHAPPILPRRPRQDRERSSIRAGLAARGRGEGAQGGGHPESQQAQGAGPRAGRGGKGCHAAIAIARTRTPTTATATATSAREGGAGGGNPREAAADQGEVGGGESGVGVRG